MERVVSSLFSHSFLSSCVCLPSSCFIPSPFVLSQHQQTIILKCESSILNGFSGQYCTNSSSPTLHRLHSLSLMALLYFPLVFILFTDREQSFWEHNTSERNTISYILTCRFMELYFVNLMLIYSLGKDGPQSGLSQLFLFDSGNHRKQTDWNSTLKWYQFPPHTAGFNEEAPTIVEQSLCQSLRCKWPY